MAADDLEGIARWRLAEEEIRHKVAETHRALRWLVDSNFLRLTQTIGPAPVFSLNHDRLADANAFLGSDGAATQAGDEPGR